MNNGWIHTDVTVVAGGPLVIGSILSVTIVNGDARVYHLADDRHVHQLAREENKWRHEVVSDVVGWDSVNAITLSATTVKEEPRVYCLTANYHVYELARVNNQWRLLDISGDLEDRTGANTILGSTEANVNQTAPVLGLTELQIDMPQYLCHPIDVQYFGVYGQVSE
jgi:hypothetical protein